VAKAKTKVKAFWGEQPPPGMTEADRIDPPNGTGKKKTKTPNGTAPKTNKGMVKAALEANVTNPAAGVAWIQTNFGALVSRELFASYAAAIRREAEEKERAEEFTRMLVTAETDAVMEGNFAPFARLLAVTIDPKEVLKITHRVQMFALGVAMTQGGKKD
jgi:hypothetical protein